MEPTTIILIVIFVVCGLFLLWAVKNGNNIKAKKKDKKQKSKSPKEEEFKDVVPKEKKEKTEKKKSEKIRQSAKDEKSGKSAGPTNKVMKVTKEDFKLNDMAVPKSLDETKSDLKSKPVNKDDDFKIPELPSDFKIPELPSDFKIPLLKSSGLDDYNFKDDIWSDDDFLGSDPDLMGVLPPIDDMSFNDDLNLGKVDNLPPIDFGSLPKIDTPAKMNMPKVEGKIENEPMDERFKKVFGSTGLESSGAKEVIIGDILSGNRSKTNRELREKRTKWMK